MPVPANAARYEIRGTGPGAEIWMTGFWLQATTAYADEATLAAQAGLIKPFVVTWWTSVKANIYSSFSLTELRAYSYAGGSDRAQFGAAISISTAAGSQAGSGSPIDTCIVVSTRTDFVGRSRRGRMYVPYHGSITPATGLMTATSTDYAAITKTLLDSVNGLSADKVAVVSRTLGDSMPITHVTFDQKPDVQRRRENRLSGGPVTVAFLA